MRLSADPKSGHFSRWSSHARIWLNGEELKGVREADDEGGWVDVFAEDGAGKLLVDDGALVTERRFGKVRIVIDHPNYDPRAGNG